MKMLRAAHDKMCDSIALQRVHHLRHGLMSGAAKKTREPFHASDLAHCCGGNRKSESTHGEQDHVFACALARQCAFLSHSAPTFAAPKMYSTRFSIAVYIPS